jgi:hypothetical protein
MPKEIKKQARRDLWAALFKIVKKIETRGLSIQWDWFGHRKEPSTWHTTALMNFEDIEWKKLHKGTNTTHFHKPRTGVSTDWVSAGGYQVLRKWGAVAWWL